MALVLLIGLFKRSKWFFSLLQFIWFLINNYYLIYL
jgi:hypothetical protein